MRYLYVDEAGTSAREQVSVVAAVVVDADKQWRAAEAELKRLFDETVPPDIRPKFIFHAKDVFGGGQHREAWNREQRRELMRGMVSLPRRLGLAISIGMARRNTMPTAWFEGLPKTVRPEMIDHAIAFEYCIASADNFVRKTAGVGEVATVVIEDVPPMKHLLRLSARRLHEQPFVFKPEHLRHDVSDVTPEKLAQGAEMKVERLVDVAQFAAKDEAPLLQIADAVAFTWRRWINNQSEGEDLMRLMIQPLPVLSDWSGLSSSGTWAWRVSS